jgi:ubiquinone/menaquinone biosynthesis C-methylase UbiE
VESDALWFGGSDKPDRSVLLFEPALLISYRTGITTLAILLAYESVRVLSVDSEPLMQVQAKQSLRKWTEQGRLDFDGRDALTVLQNTATASMDIVASAYTLHNFLDSYRAQVITEIYRVLKPGGQFINGDRYGLAVINGEIRLF